MHAISTQEVEQVVDLSDEVVSINIHSLINSAKNLNLFLAKNKILAESKNEEMIRLVYSVLSWLKDKSVTDPKLIEELNTFIKDSISRDPVIHLFIWQMLAGFFQKQEVEPSLESAITYKQANKFESLKKKYGYLNGFQVVLKIFDETKADMQKAQAFLASNPSLDSEEFFTIMVDPTDKNCALLDSLYEKCYETEAGSLHKEVVSLKEDGMPKVAVFGVVRKKALDINNSALLSMAYNACLHKATMQSIAELIHRYFPESAVPQEKAVVKSASKKK